MPASKTFKRSYEASTSFHSKDLITSTHNSAGTLVDYKKDSSNKKLKEVPGRLTSAKKLQENVENSDINTEHILMIQQLKDNILELTQKVSVKEQIIFEKDKKVFFYPTKQCKNNLS